MALQIYKKVENALSARELYEPVPMEELMPIERRARFRFLAGLSMPFPVTIYKVRFGGRRAAAVFAWKIPEKLTDRNPTANANTVVSVLKDLGEVHSRARQKNLRKLVYSLRNNTKQNV